MAFMFFYFFMDSHFMPFEPCMSCEVFVTDVTIVKFFLKMDQPNMTFQIASVGVSNFTNVTNTHLLLIRKDNHQN